MANQYIDPYRVLRRTIGDRVTQAEEAELNPQPMFSPEEQAQRQQAHRAMMLQGQVGALANDKSISGISGPLLKEAMRAASPQYKDHGLFNEVTGDFKFFPGYREAKRADSARKDQMLVEDRAARAEAAWNLMQERAEQQRMLKALVAGLKGPKAEPGTISHVGSIAATGQPIFNNSKTGPFTYGQDGQPQPYRGPISPRLAEPGGAVQSAYFKNRAGLSQVRYAAGLTQENPDAVGAVAWLPDAISQYIPGKAGKEGVGTRAAVADLGSLKIHDRSGAAVSAMEFPRLRPFIPNVRVDSPSTIAQKLKGFERTYNEMVDLIEKGYPLSRLVQMTGPAGSAAPTNGGMADADQALMDKYLKPQGAPSGQ